jgi:hypothetical protein
MPVGAQLSPPTAGDVLIQAASQLKQVRPGLAGVRKLHQDRPTGP